MAIPPSVYDSKARFWSGVAALNRYPPQWDMGTFDEYLGNPSVVPSRHQDALRSSKGLLELHYDSMRKKAEARAQCATQLKSPSMGRAHALE
eukprot:g29257.t1